MASSKGHTKIVKLLLQHNATGPIIWDTVSILNVYSTYTCVAILLKITFAPYHLFTYSILNHV